MGETDNSDHRLWTVSGLIKSYHREAA
jgi:hypothetical protein